MKKEKEQKKNYTTVESLLDAKKSGIGYVSGDRKKEEFFQT